MRGNDVLSGAPDVMVMDSLTGNLVIKMLSSFASGGRTSPWAMAMARASLRL